MRTPLIAIGLVLAATPVAGQATFQFRYNPAPGRVVHGITVIRTLTTMQGLPRVPDGATLEVEARIFSHDRTLDAGANGFRVDVGVDSVRVRQRENGAAWMDGEAPAFAGLSTLAAVNERLHVVGIETTNSEDGLLLRVLTAWSANLGFAFPDSAVAVGSTFRTGGQMPFDVSLDEAVGLSVREVLMGELQFTLDSVVARGADTLAYLRISGTFTPRTIESTGEAGTRSDTFEGGFAGSLLWSTGWDAFVAAGVRVRVTDRLHQESAAGVIDAAVEWDATLVHRIRP